MDSESTDPENGRIQRLDHLVELCRTLSLSPSLESSLDSLIAAAAELTRNDLGYILELELGKDQLHFLALPATYRDILATIKVPVQASVAGWVLQNTKPAVVPDFSTDPRYFKSINLSTGMTTRSAMAVPITYQGETLGVLEVSNQSKQAYYTEEDLRILETLGSLAAVVIHNNHLESKVQHALDQMIQLERMKTDFIAIASHELRTPLGIILGTATFLRETMPSDRRDQMEIIVQNSMRLKEIISDLASMDNVQQGMASLRTRSISMKRILDEVLGSFRQEAQEKQLSIRAETGQGDLMLEGDQSKIAIVLSNLVKNAITFTNPGGHIFVEAESIPGYIKVAVIDDGIGIPSKDLPNIFDRFYQVESHLTRTHGGMGLGLSVAKVMVELHGGSIWAESEEGKGSTFTFQLPVKSDQVGDTNQVLPS